MSDRHPLTLNSLGGRAVFAHADVVLVVGSRFADTMFGVPSWQAQATTPAQIPTLVREAVKALRSGRPQPVGLEIAPDVLSASGDVTLIEPPAHEDNRMRPDPTAIEKAAALMATSRFPVIYVGGGVLASGATAALQALAEQLSVAVVLS